MTQQISDQRPDQVPAPDSSTGLPDQPLTGPPGQSVSVARAQFPKARRAATPPWIRVLITAAVAATWFTGSHHLEYLLGVAVGAFVLRITAGVIAARRSGSRQSADMGYGQPRQGGPVPSGYATPRGSQTGCVPAGPPPPTYLAWRIIASVCGLLFNVILGLPAARIGGRYSNQAAELWASGDEEAAASASRKARGWLTAATVLDALGLILIIVLITQVLSSPPNFNNPPAVAASIKSQLQQQLNGQYYEPGVTVTSAVCTRSGTSTDHCVVTLSSGQTFATTAVILDNGEGFRTQGFHAQ
jgi:Interferon-induced transmembrane protein